LTMMIPFIGLGVLSIIREHLAMLSMCKESCLCKKCLVLTALIGSFLLLSDQTKGDCKEGFYIGPEAKDEDKEIWSPKPFHGPNQWPSNGMCGRDKLF
jgi:isopenicillin N synthase-like dioxygenase